MTGLIVFRNFTNIGNNALGHVLYVDQLIQDGLAGSVVAAEFTPVTAAINEVLAGVKVGLDEVQMGTDIIVEVESLYESNHAPNSAEAERWEALADGYAANILGDVVKSSSTSSASRARAPQHRSGRAGEAAADAGGRLHEERGADHHLGGQRRPGRLARQPGHQGTARAGGFADRPP